MGSRESARRLIYREPERSRVHVWSIPKICTVDAAPKCGSTVAGPVWPDSWLMRLCAAAALHDGGSSSAQHGAAAMARV